MTYDQWKDPTDYSPDDDSDWLSLVDALEDEIDCPCNADCSAMPNGPLYNCPYLRENRRT